MLEYVLLGFLTLYPMSGYGLKQFMTMSTSNFMDASFGSIYPALKRLEKKGFVVSRSSVESGKFTKVYSVTPEGEAEFERWLGVPGQVGGGSNEHLVKLFFYDRFRSKELKEKLEDCIKAAREETEKLEALRDSLDCSALPMQKATLEFGLQYYAMAQEFYRTLLDRAESK